MSQVEQATSSSNSSINSTSNSISLIKLDELSSFAATKQSRLPALIKLNQPESEQSSRQLNSMPALSATQMESSSSSSSTGDKQQASLPAGVELSSDRQALNKENTAGEQSEDFQMINLDSATAAAAAAEADEALMGPSLPQAKDVPLSASQQANLMASNQQPPSHLGDSLIEMIINLKNENQNLVRALETNNDYVKERLAEFKKVNEESKKKEAQFALEKAEHEHQVRKLQRQNTVLSERLKSMETKLKDMKFEVDETLNAASSSKASSIRGENNMYPNLNEFGDDITMQIDATSGELYNHGSLNSLSKQQQEPQTSEEAAKVSNMTKEELSKRFDADKAEFYANQDDPMKQCDKLEKQLNDIGRRDYEICLLQQQLNIYRQDYRLERMANLEAKLQIEKLKNDIDRLCYERLRNKTSSGDEDDNDADLDQTRAKQAGVRFSIPGPAVAAADAVINRLGTHLSKKAARSAAKAAKYASKQAHREEKAAMAAAAAAAAAAGASSSSGSANEAEHHHHHGRGARHHHHHRPRGVRSEVVNDLLSTANKAMLTGYKMASTHVNLALDKLSQYEQQQARNLATSTSSATTGAAGSSANKMAPSAPPMGPPSVD